jgi:hypothetical protein
VPVTAKQLTALSESFDWDAYTTKLHAALTGPYTAVAREQGQREADAHDLDDWETGDAFTERFFTQYLADRVTQLSDTTQDLLTRLLQATVESHTSESNQEIAGRIRDLDPYAFSPARALTIARTETATAYNHGAGLTYKQNGLEEVDISDGDDDDECAAADGSTWTVDEFLDDPLAHPNCVRSGAPHVRDLDEDDE